MSDVRCTKGACLNWATRHFRHRLYTYIVVSRCDAHALDDHALEPAYKDGWYEVTYESLVVAEVHES